MEAGRKGKGDSLYPSWRLTHYFIIIILAFFVLYKLCNFYSIESPMKNYGRRHIDSLSGESVMWNRRGFIIRRVLGNYEYERHQRLEQLSGLS